MRTTLLYVLFLASLVVLAGEQTFGKTLYYDDFDGAPGVALNTTVPDVTINDAAWEAGSAVMANGALGSLFTAVLPFVPEIGTVYEVSATLENEGDWAAIGFLTNPTNLDTRILDNNVVLWCLAREPGSANFDQAFVGPGTAGAQGDASVSSSTKLMVRLETTSASEWLVTWFFDGARNSNRRSMPPRWTSTTWASVSTGCSTRPVAASSTSSWWR